VASFAVQSAMAQRPAVQPVRPGDAFPGGNYKVFNPVGDQTTFDLATVLGKKPVVLFYWIPGNERAELVFQELLATTRDIGSDKLAVFGVAVSNPGIGVTPDVIRDRIAKVGVDVPVFSDEDFDIGQALKVRSVPNISVIDKEGRLKLSNGASMKQDLEYKVDVEVAIRRVASTGDLHNYGILEAYYPVKEMEGQPSPDFTAPQLMDSVEQRWHSLIDDKKVNVLIFWSVDCPHCRKQIPEINAWLEQNPEQMNVVGCATVRDQPSTIKTREFGELNSLSFLNLVDMNAAIGQLYGVTTTPTIVVVRPDGVVDTAVTSSVTDFGNLMERKKRELL
jgi:thiol-disulfide isomerase/thioredoxin